MTSPDTHDDKIRTTLAGLLRAWGALLDDGRFARAAGVLTGAPAGRPPRDDTAALALARELLATGAARSRHAACGFVATLVARPHETETTRARLMRKWRAAEKSSAEKY